MVTRNNNSPDDQLVATKESPLKRTLMIGFVGGLFWSFIWIITYYFNFTEIAPKSYLLRSWIYQNWTDTLWGDVVSIGLSSIVSMFIALSYYFLFKKATTSLAGILFGLVLWGVVFYLLQPIFPNIPSLQELDKNTIVTTISLFTVYGTFIGYSVSYDYHEYYNQ